MWKENIYRPIEILLREHDEFPIGEHEHSFIEMTYIAAGSGSLDVRTENCAMTHYAYRDGDLFVMPPSTLHKFVTGTHTRYVFIRFTADYANDYVAKGIGDQLATAASFRACPDEKDKTALRQLADLILVEAASGGLYSESLLHGYANAMILTAARTLAGTIPSYTAGNDSGSRARYLMHYLQQHIGSPERITIRSLAVRFNMSPGYVNHYFKRNFGESLHRYCLKLRLRAAESMLVGTDLTLKEIAYRTGFCDEAHLSHVFSRHYHVTPARYRRSHAATATRSGLPQ